MAPGVLPKGKFGDVEVASIGFGAMGISVFYGAVGSDEERLKVLDAVYESGCNHWDTANVYGDSEDLIGKWFKRSGKRSEIFLASKFGHTNVGAIDGTPENARKTLDAALQRLGVDYIDLYYLHRPDKNVPIEKTVGAMAELVKEGKIKYIGLSECSAATLRRAHAVHPITAVQVEYSPFALDIEYPDIGILKAARELGITIVAYSPLGRGLLTGRYKSPNDFEEGDGRRLFPRFSEENFPNILALVDTLQKIGNKYNATSGQVTLAWLLAQGNDILPIPGTRNIKYLKENVGAAEIKLTEDEVAEIRNLAERIDNATKGKSRYPPGMDGYLFGDTPEL